MNAFATFAPLALALLVGLAAPAAAQPKPGTADPARITGGTYTVDRNHTQITWTVDHLGLSPLSGMFGASAGTLVLDPKNPAAATLEITVPMAAPAVTSKSFAQDLASAELLDAAKFPEASFKSSRVTPDGTRATVDGELTLHGVTRPLTLEATFFGAGVNPRSGRENVGFTAVGVLKRSEFGLGLAAPAVSDEVRLTLVGAFEKQP